MDGHARSAGRRGRRVFTLAVSVATAAALFATVGTSNADVTTVKGSAYGYFLRVGLFGGAPQDRGPAPTVTLAPDASNSPQNATLGAGVAQVGPAIFFEWGGIDVSTAGSLGPGGFATSSSTVNNIITTRGGALSATSAASTCRASEVGNTGAVTVTGSTTFVNGVLEIDSGNDVNGDGDYTDPGEHAPVTVPVPTAPAPNSPPIVGHIHLDATSPQEDFTYQFNEQITNLDGSLTVYAAHQRILGPIAVGNLFIGKSECGLTAVPGTTTTTTTTRPTTTTTRPTTTTTRPTTTTTRPSTTTTRPSSTTTTTRPSTTTTRPTTTTTRPTTTTTRPSTTTTRVPPPSTTTTIPDGPVCAGRPATIVGTPGPDQLVGTSRSDVIVGLGGDDMIAGLEGNDFICAGGGNDSVDGGPGNDTIGGGGGEDRIAGGPGNDVLRGQAGRDIIDAGTGTNVLNGGPDIDTCASSDPATSTFISCEITPQGSAAAAGAPSSFSSGPTLRPAGI